MKIVVCVKHVPDATADRSFGPDDTVDRAATDGVLSELDEYAVEAALQIREAGDAEITIMTLGPEPARAAILKSLQMGADAGVHIVDDAVHGSDSLATSLVLAKALEHTGFDLVLCGMASTDGSMSVVPAMLAERLGVPQVTFASEVSLDGTTVRARRDGDAAVETIEATLPVVMSVTDQANEPRYPSFKGIMAAKKKPVSKLGISDLGLDGGEVGPAGSLVKVESFAPRPPKSGGQKVSDEGDGGAKIAEFLVGQKLI